MLIPQFRPRSSAVLALISRTARGFFPWHFFQDPCDRALAADVAAWTDCAGVGRGFAPVFVLDARELSRVIRADPSRLWAVEVVGWRLHAGAPHLIIGTPWDMRPEEVIGRLAAALDARRKPPPKPKPSTTPQPRELRRLESGRGVNRALRNHGWDRFL